MQKLNLPKNQDNYHLRDQHIGALIYLHSDIDLFFIDYTCCKLCNTWLLLFENNSRSYHSTWASHWRKNFIAVITQDRVIDDNLKGQIKDRTLYSCWLFPLAQIFQYINNFQYINYLGIYPPSFFNIHKVIIFPTFFG